MKTGILTLIPTPIDDESPLELVALALLQEHCLLENTVLLVEELKIARRKWIKWGLPREAIERFVAFNEHNMAEEAAKYLEKLKNGCDVFVISDCGLPAFCDPGQHLVDLCHQQGVRVTATPFGNSIALSVSLSGFAFKEFIFRGSLPRREDERIRFFKEVNREERMQILMDTPYRLRKLLEEGKEHLSTQREYFLGLNLNMQTEVLLRGSMSKLAKLNPFDKAEFIFVVGPKS